MKKNLSAGVLLIALGASGAGLAQNPQDEVDKQVSKAVSDAISARLTAQALTATEAPPNNVWGSAGSVSIEGSGGGSTFDAGVPIFLAGYDRDLGGKAMLGFSLSYYSTSFQVGPASVDMWGYSISPYFAYLFNSNYFASAKLTYGYTEFESDPPLPAGCTSPSPGITQCVAIRSMSIYGYGLEGALNALFRPGNLVTKGVARAGWSEARTETTSNSSTQYGAEAEIGYLLGSRSYVFASLQMSDSSVANTYQLSARVGFDQQLGQAVTLGVKYEKRLDDDVPSPLTVDVQSLFFTFRVAF